MSGRPVERTRIKGSLEASVRSVSLGFVKAAAAAAAISFASACSEPVLATFEAGS